jgi:hypothetical protein
MIRSRTAVAMASFALAALGAGAAQAQTVTPSAPTELRPTDPPPPPPSTGDDSGAAEAAPDARAAAPTGEFMSSGDDLGADDESQSLKHVGSVPEVHVVRKGDTLWDICGYYFNNPWEWPKIWSYNPTITNPHWIYPGDVVRLHPGGEGPAAESEPTQGKVEPSPRMLGGAPASVAKKTVDLRQVAFVSDEELKVAGTIVGSSDEKIMLAQGDEVYLDYPDGQPPQIGQKYAIYTDQREVKHPKTGKVVGAYVTLRGEVKILEVKKGRKARGVITYSTDIVERGMRVGPGRTQFKEVAPVPPSTDLEGQVVAVLATEQLVGDNQIVFLDNGSDDGLKIGNQMRVVRRGDAYIPRMSPNDAAGRNDTSYPDDAIGLLIIVDVGQHSSVAFVVDAAQEIEPGDHVVMRKSP